MLPPSSRTATLAAVEAHAALVADAHRRGQPPPPPLLPPMTTIGGRSTLLGAAAHSARRLVLIVSRPAGTDRRVLNELDLARDLAQVVGARGMYVALLNLAALPTIAQLSLVEHSAMMIGTHGAGLLWNLFLPHGAPTNPNPNPNLFLPHGAPSHLHHIASATRPTPALTPTFASNAHSVAQTRSPKLNLTRPAA